MVLAYPVASEPVGDDFSYTKTALDLATTGHFRYNGWTAPTQGWQPFWGAAYIKLFGFSFTVLRLSMIPIAMASIYLFHQILVGFNIQPRAALLGVLSFAFCPVFFLSSSTYMTDTPGVFAVLLCLYMCQRVFLASSNRAALLWLVSASLLNVAAGSVRQTSWLGALVMVPCTAWFVRDRPNMLRVAARVTVLSAAAIFFCLRWANGQPGFVPEPFLVPAQFLRGSYYVVGQWGKAALCFVFVLSPILVGWLPGLRALTRAAQMRIFALVCAMGIILLFRAHHGELAKWVLPWIPTYLGALGMSEPDVLLGGRAAIPIQVRVVLSLVVAFIGLVFAESLVDRKLRRLDSSPAQYSWRAAHWVTVPFLLCYLATIIPRSAYDQIQDRYFLPIMPCVILLLLLRYQKRFGFSEFRWSFFVLWMFGIYAVAATHDLYASFRAAHLATQELEQAGVPRTAIVQDFGSDGWVQVQQTGYFNSSNMIGASRLNKEPAKPWPIPQSCNNYLPAFGEPVIEPQFFIGSTPTRCLSPSHYPPVSYRAWLPPFHRQRIVEEPLPPYKHAR